MKAPVEAQRYRVAEDYVLENVDGEILLYHPVSETMVYCNVTAAYVWGLCDGAHTLDEIVALFVACYPDDATDIPAQVHDTVAELRQRGVLFSIDDAPIKTADARSDLPHVNSEPRTLAAVD
jgi:hypothetical protein